MDKIKLYTFPYAGGNSNIFRPWKRQLNSLIELHPVELAGRGIRMSDPMRNSIQETVDDLENLFVQNNSNYALFGHSMGTLIIFELLSLMRKKNIKPPLHVFFSGRKAPHLNTDDEKKYHLMDNEQFRKEVIKLGGTPVEIFDDPELADLFLPVLKNDFKICETYMPHIPDHKYDMNFSVLAGLDEGYLDEELTAYGDFTTGETTVHYFQGGHFFIKESEKDVVDFINRTLLKYR